MGMHTVVICFLLRLWQNNGCVRLYCFHFSLGSLMFWLFNLLSIYGKKATNHLSMGIIVLEPDR